MLSFLAEMQNVTIVAIADIYEPSIDESLKIVPHAKVYRNYRYLLEDKNIEACIS